MHTTTLRDPRHQGEPLDAPGLVPEGSEPGAAGDRTCCALSLALEDVALVLLVLEVLEASLREPENVGLKNQADLVLRLRSLHSRIAAGATS